jgi:hypothetical protein
MDSRRSDGNSAITAISRSPTESTDGVAERHSIVRVTQQECPYTHGLGTSMSSRCPGLSPYLGGREVVLPGLSPYPE